MIKRCLKDFFFWGGGESFLFSTLVMSIKSYYEQIRTLKITITLCTQPSKLLVLFTFDFFFKEKFNYQFSVVLILSHTFYHFV